MLLALILVVFEMKDYFSESKPPRCKVQHNTFNLIQNLLLRVAQRRVVSPVQLVARLSEIRTWTWSRRGSDFVETSAKQKVAPVELAQLNKMPKLKNCS